MVVDAITSERQAVSYLLTFLVPALGLSVESSVAVCCTSASCMVWTEQYFSWEMRSSLSGA